MASTASMKKRNSHGHPKCINKLKITPKSCYLSALSILSYFRLTSTNRFHCGNLLCLERLDVKFLRQYGIRGPSFSRLLRGIGFTDQ